MLLGTQTLIKIRDQLLMNSELESKLEKYEERISAANDQQQFSVAVCKKSNKESNRKFKKAVRKIIIALRMLYSSIRRLQSKESIESGSCLFDKSVFSRPKEPPVPDEAKRMMNLEPKQRTEEMVRYITICLSFSVPEFLEFPIHMQKRIALYAYYEEYGPSRVIIRQGHEAHNYYMIITGNALIIDTKKESRSDDYVYKPIAHLKRGDCFGDLALINNTRRASTITVCGEHPLSVLVIEREDFFRVQTPITSEAERNLFLKNKVSVLQAINYPVEILNQTQQKNLFSIYYRNGLLTKFSFFSFIQNYRIFIKLFNPL